MELQGTSFIQFPRIDDRLDSVRSSGVLHSPSSVAGAADPRLAVDIREARLTYGRGHKANETLRGINLKVREGEIYGLLGPSGCGKTTLLRCVVGRLTPDEGSVTVFGMTPGECEGYIPGPGIGYMPQELALYSEFTIFETLTYFGRLFQLERKVMKERTAFLLKFLDLPDKRRLVGKLSGGQIRRVSLASALIHNPPLLILDEPTVGVDPVLRQSIWHYLVTLTVKEQMTIIITTHYIEEARQANTVGLMRHGRMLAEAEPNELLLSYNLPTLEDVFLKLCQADNRTNNVSTTPFSVALPPSTPRAAPDQEGSGKRTSKGRKMTGSMAQLVQSNSIEFIHNSGLRDSTLRRREKARVNTVSRTTALLGKCLTRIGRNLPVLLFQFLVPSIQVILFCLCIGRDPFDLPVAIVNRDEQPILSRPFLKHLHPLVVSQVYYNDLDSALDAVRTGKAWGLLSIGVNFSTALQYRFLLGVDADDKVIEESNVDVYLDMTNQQIGYTLQKVILDAFRDFSEAILTRMNKNPRLASTPVIFRAPVYGEASPTFTEFMAPGVILSITYIMAVGLTALSMVAEQKEGLLERSWVAGVKPFEVILSHVLTQCLVLLVQVALLLIFTFLVFSIPTKGPIFWVILLTLLQGTCGMAYGLVISAVCSEETSAIMLALGSFYPNILLSGIIWPVQSMPEILRYISYGLPQTIPTESLRCILSRGRGVAQYEVWVGFMVSVAWTAFFMLFSVVAFRMRK